MSSFLAAGFGWLPTEATSAATATRATTAMTARARTKARIDPPVTCDTSTDTTGHAPGLGVPYSARSGGQSQALPRPARHASLDGGDRAVYHPRAMPRPARWITAIPHVVVTVLMLVAMADMLAGVFLRYVMTKISAVFDL